MDCILFRHRSAPTTWQASLAVGQLAVLPGSSRCPRSPHAADRVEARILRAPQAIADDLKLDQRWPIYATVVFSRGNAGVRRFGSWSSVIVPEALACAQAADRDRLVSLSL